MTGKTGKTCFGSLWSCLILFRLFDLVWSWELHRGIRTPAGHHRWTTWCRSRTGVARGASTARPGRCRRPGGSVVNPTVAAEPAPSPLFFYCFLYEHVWTNAIEMRDDQIMDLWLWVLNLYRMNLENSNCNFQVHKRGPMWPLGGPDSDRSKSFGRQRRGVCYCRAWLSFELMGPCKQATATLFFWDDECAHLHVVCEQHFFNQAL